MRYSALVLSALLLSGGLASAQTGFSTKTYPAVLPAGSDNTMLLSADFNNDGRPDLVAYGARYGYSGQSTPPGNVFLNNGSGGFLAPQPLEGALPMEFAAIADVNGDGHPDIVGCANTGSDRVGFDIFVYTNNGNGTFSYYPYSFVNGQCHGLAVGDVYHNGHVDIVFGETTTSSTGAVTNSINVLKNDGTGKFTAQTPVTVNLDDPNTSSSFTNCGLIDLVGADFLQNGGFDLVLTSNCSPAGQNNPGNLGTAFFAPENSSDSYSSLTHIQSAYEDYNQGKVVELNNNGNPDVLFSGDDGGGYGGDLIYFRNNGDGSFTVSKLLDAPQVVYGSTAADFNGDGLNDIATSYTQGSSTNPAPPMIAILAGTSSGTFTQSQTFATGPTTSLGGDVVAADFNGDGKPDLATLVYDSNTRTTSLIVYTNTQGGSSTACSAPTTVNTNKICSPVSGSTESSPVTVNAASNVSGFTLNRLYLDNNSVYQTTSQTVSTPINAANGSHTLVLVSYDNTGHAFTSSSSFTVGSGTSSGCSTSTAGVNICAPGAGSTDSSPVTITAAAMAQSGNITAIRAYVDNVAVFTTSNPSAIRTFEASQSVSLGGGTHHLVVLGYQSTGGQVSSSLNFTISGSGPCYPSSQGAEICSPKAGSTSSSPVSVVAGVTTGTGYIAAIRVYIDNVAQPVVNNPQQTKSFQIQQSETVGAGSHELVVVGYPSTGGSISTRESFTIQ